MVEGFIQAEQFTQGTSTPNDPMIGKVVYVSFARAYGEVVGVEVGIDLTGQKLYSIILDNGQAAEAYESQISE